MNLTYEILENGYVIKNNGEVWIEQVEPFIPDRTKSYEENAKEQIQEILDGKSAEQKRIEQEAIDNYTLELMEGGLL